MNRASRRFVAAIPAGLLALSVAAGCSATVPGAGAPAPVEHAFQAHNAEQLAQFLVDVPPGMTEETDTWAGNETPAVDDFASQIYNESSTFDGGDYLRDAGVVAVAHRVWHDDAGSGADVALLLFETDDQPPAWMIAENRADYGGGLVPVTVSADPWIEGFTFPRDAGDDVTDTRLYSARGRVGILVDNFTVDDFDPAQAKEWITAQYDELG